ncbi:hypothetical protein D3C73_1654840 [compost metagenome]
MMETHNNSSQPKSPVAVALPASTLPNYDSSQLLSAEGVAIIIHQGQRYQLRQTKAGKLILTK